ncbi:MAG: hypothetical protein ACK4NP_12640 [Parvularculaceae bacterium]
MIPQVHKCVPQRSSEVNADLRPRSKKLWNFGRLFKSEESAAAAASGVFPFSNAPPDTAPQTIETRHFLAAQHQFRVVEAKAGRPTGLRGARRGFYG